MALADFAGGVQDALRQLVADRMARTKMDQEQKMAEAQQRMAESRLGIEQADQQFRRERAGVADLTAAKDETRAQEEHSARLGQIRTQTRDIEQRPLYEEQKRQYDERTTAAERKHDIELEKLRQGGAFRLANLRTRQEDIRTDDKTAAAQAQAEAQSDKIAQSARETLDVVGQLIDDRGQLRPGVSPIVGFGGPLIGKAASLIGGTEMANKQAALSRLQSRMLVDLIAEMKAQTKTGATGFGQLSEKEGQILQHAAAQLDQAQTEGQMQQVLHDIRISLLRIALGGDPQPDQGPPNPTLESARGKLLGLRGR